MRELILAVAVLLGVCFAGCMADSIHKARQLSELTGEDIPPLAGLFIEVDPEQEALLIQQIQNHLPEYMKKDAQPTQPQPVVSEEPMIAGS